MKCLNAVSYKDCVGKLCKSLNSGDFKIDIRAYNALMKYEVGIDD